MNEAGFFPEMSDMRCRDCQCQLTSLYLKKILPIFGDVMLHSYPRRHRAPPAPFTTCPVDIRKRAYVTTHGERCL